MSAFNKKHVNELISQIEANGGCCVDWDEVCKLKNPFRWVLLNFLSEYAQSDKEFKKKKIMKKHKRKKGSSKRIAKWIDVKELNRLGFRKVRNDNTRWRLTNGLASPNYFVLWVYTYKNNKSTSLEIRKGEYKTVFFERIQIKSMKELIWLIKRSRISIYLKN